MSQVQAAVLFVEDNEPNRDMLMHRLTQEGYVVSAAQNGRAALALMQVERYDLVLLDIMMPGLDGFEVLEHIRNQADTRALPVVLLSAVTNQEPIARCFMMGADDYINKPFSHTDLRVRISSCIELKELQDKEAVRRARLGEMAQSGAQISPK